MASLSKNGIIINKPSSGKKPSVNPSIATEQIAATSTCLVNLSTLALSVLNESRVFSESHDDFRIEQIENLSAEVTTLKVLFLKKYQ